MVLTGRFGFGVFISCVVWFVFGLFRGCLLFVCVVIALMLVWMWCSCCVL